MFHKIPLLQGSRVNLLLCLDQQDARGWLDGLVSQLERLGHDVETEILPIGGPPSPQPNWLLRLEPRLYGVDAAAWLAPSRRSLTMPGGAARRVRFALSPRAACDVEFQLTVEEETLASLPLRLAQGLSPRLILSGKNETRWMALPATERPFSLAFTLESYIQRLGLLIHKAASDHRPTEIPPPAPNRPRKPAAIAWRHFCTKALGLVARRHFRPDHWHVGVRPIEQGNETTLPETITDFAWIPDEGTGYLADPIVWTEGDRTFLFVEVFPFATMRGVLAVAELDPQGRPLTALEPVLSRDGHLSYPFLFQYDGETWMIPENAAEGHLPLYRASRFPDLWEECGTLLDVPLQDATLIEWEGCFWLLGNESREGSSWDCLCAYYSASPLGPFQPHSQNPLMIDARFARSAGPVFKKGGMLIRPVQDCLGGYGRAVHFMQITELSKDSFRQELVSTLRPPPGHVASGIHTYSRSARFEAVDVLTPANARPR
jgi:hypothetical protein